ncbi:hypothetical protein [Halocola ammonii]
MPGLNIHFKFSQTLKPNTLQEHSRTLFSSEEVDVSVESGSENHPVDFWETREFFIAFEGYAYDWNNHRQELEKLTQQLIVSENSGEILKSTFGKLDAEFVLFFFHKPSKKSGVVNDVLGRLPIYSCAIEGDHILTRNADFPGKLKKLTLDHQGAAESLTFGFTLGDRTVYQGVKRLAGGSYASVVGKELNFYRHKTTDYDLLLGSKPDPERTANQATELFISALESRTRFCDNPLLALSGGLDSRALAGGFDALGIQYKAITYRDVAGSAERDVEVARLITNAHSQELTLVDLKNPEKRDFLELYDCKNGQSMLDMTFMVPFLRTLRAQSENPAVFTGDGGDKVLPSLLPDSRVFKGKKLLSYALRANRKFPETTAERIFGLPSGTIRESIEQLFESYTETSWEGKFRHFTMENRARNWLFEGEDRNRCFLPSFTPFYCLPLFELLMSVDDEEKKDFRFFHRFLKKVDPKSADIKNANWGFGVQQSEQIRKIYYRQNLKLTSAGSFVRDSLKTKSNYLEKATEDERLLFEELSKRVAVQNKIDLDLIVRLKNFDADSFHFLLTLMKVAEETV